MTRRAPWVLLMAAIALCYCVLSFYRASDAAPRPEPPFANAVEQRMETVNELKEIHVLLKEQNSLLKEQMALLRSGDVKVVVVQSEKAVAKEQE